MNLIPFKSRGRLYRASGQQITVHQPTTATVTAAAQAALASARANHLRDTGSPAGAGAFVLVSVTLMVPEQRPRGGVAA